MRLLLVFEEDYRVYMHAIAEAIREFRPYLDVALTDAGKLEAAVERFEPQLVICSSPIPTNPVDPQLVSSIELSPEPDQPSRFRLGERRWEATNPALGEILSVVDETNWLHLISQEEEETTEPDKGEA